MIFQILPEKKTEMGGWRCAQWFLLQGYCRRTGGGRDGSGGQSQRGLQVFFFYNLAPKRNMLPFILGCDARITMHFFRQTFDLVDADGSGSLDR